MLLQEDLPLTKKEYNNPNLLKQWHGHRAHATVMASAKKSDNDPEFLVGVKGIDYPLCFHIDGSQNQVVRLLQDPLSGVIVNARIFHDHLTNKTYLGAILISQGNLRIIAKQRLVLFNEGKLDWLPVKTEVFQGHRIVVGDDMVAVTFRKRNITLIIRRHIVRPTNKVNYEEVEDKFSKITDGDLENSYEERTNNMDNKHFLPPASSNRADIGFKESDSILSRAMSAKRRRGLLLQNLFGIHQGQTFARNVIVEVDSEKRTRRSTLKLSYNVPNQIGDKTYMSKRHQGRQKEMYFEPTQHMSLAFRHLFEQRHYSKGLVKKTFNGRPLETTDNYISHQRAMPGRHQRETEEDYTVDESPASEDTEKKREQTFYLGLYIADSRDLSNKTHGLLGQFLYKNVSIEKIRYRNGKMIARLLINGNPSRRTPAMLTLRHNMALNATRACLKIREQGREVIDGNYSDYLVPNIRYVSLKELPPL